MKERWGIDGVAREEMHLKKGTLEKQREVSTGSAVLHAAQ